MRAPRGRGRGRARRGRARAGGLAEPLAHKVLGDDKEEGHDAAPWYGDSPRSRDLVRAALVGDVRHVPRGRPLERAREELLCDEAVAGGSEVECVVVRRNKGVQEVLGPEPAPHLCGARGG